MTLWPSLHGGTRLARHEIPTHLTVEDRVALGLSLRQVLYLLVGLAGAYGAWNQWDALPDGARAALAATCLLVAAAVALCRPGHRGLDEWVIALLRYTTVPKRAVWRARIAAEPGTEACVGAPSRAGDVAGWGAWGEEGAGEALPWPLWRPLWVPATTPARQTAPAWRRSAPVATPVATGQVTHRSGAGGTRADPPGTEGQP
jgi:hypothetical protein